MSDSDLKVRTSIELPDPLAPAAPIRAEARLNTLAADGATTRRPHRTWQQILGALILTAACVAAATWYVPRVLSNNSRLLTGSVLTSGISTLNFTSTGQIARLAVRDGERVHRGQLLAAEYAPAVSAELTADQLAIDSEKTKLAEMSAVVARTHGGGRQKGAAPTPADLAAVRAQVRADQAQLASDRARAAGSRIVAPAAGTIIAANGSPGEAVTPEGIRDYASVAPHSSVDQTPSFSLLPEGPQVQNRSSSSTSMLPVIALRTSSSWKVAVLVSENEVARLRVGSHVGISVPAAKISNIPGRLSELLSTPVPTSQGPVYQALVTASGDVAAPPLAGMAANVTLLRPSPPR
jgi:multidrug resistance efflux pump